jgi:hypothetical protein
VPAANRRVRIPAAECRVAIWRPVGELVETCDRFGGVVIDGRLVAGYLRLASPGHDGELVDEVVQLVARLRELVLARVSEAAALLDSERADPEALATVARAIEEAGRDDPTFAREVAGLCDELARLGAGPVHWSPSTVTCPQCGHLARSGHVFCDHCGTFLEWASVTTPPGSANFPAQQSQPPPAIEAPSALGTDSEPAVRAPAAPAAHTPRLLRKPRFGGRRPRISIDTPMPKLEVSGAAESSRLHAQTLIDRALSTYVRQGRLLFSPPGQMRQGRMERVDVAIAQHGGLDAQLRALAPGMEDALIQDLETTPFMEVDLKGPAFSIVSLQASDSAEQLLRPTALWQFDVTPERGGMHSLRLRVAMRIPLPDRDERVSLPALERTVRVRVDAAYSGRRFIRAHWQWVIATAAGLGGAVGAWIKLIQD